VRTTRQLVSIIQDYMPEVPSARVLEYLSRAYLELINGNSSQNVFYLEGSNSLPLLNTQVGVRKYALNSANLVDENGDPISLSQNGTPVTARKLRNVFVDGSVYGLSPYSSNDYPYGYGSWYSSKVFSKIPCQSYNQRGEAPATILLFDDYDTDIWVEFYYTPSDLTSNTDTMLIDVDTWSDALIDGAVGYYEDVVNGRSERLLRFQSQWKRSYLNSGMDNLMDKIANKFKPREVG